MRTNAIVVSMGLLFATAATAQPRPPREHGPRPHGVPPELIEKLGDELKLQDKQRTQIRDLADEARKAQAKVRAEMEINEIDLRRELEKDEPDEKRVGALVDKLSSLEAEARKAQLGAWLKIRRLLSKEQRAKLQELHEKHREEMRKRHEGRPRPDGPPHGDGPPPAPR